MVRRTETQHVQTDRAITACPEPHRHDKLKHRSLGASQFNLLFMFFKNELGLVVQERVPDSWEADAGGLLSLKSPWTTL